MALVLIAFSTTVDRPTGTAAPPMRLVDDGGGEDTSEPPYDPSESPSGQTPSPSDGPGDEDDKDGEPGPGNGDDQEESFLAMPVAAQAGLSVGVIALAAVALIPGRKPPART